MFSCVKVTDNDLESQLQHSLPIIGVSVLSSVSESFKLLVSSSEVTNSRKLVGFFSNQLILLQL